MTQGKPSAALKARLRTKGQLPPATDTLMATYDALRPLEKQSKDFNYVSWR
jgi:hypothetical protein